jgi:organic radical activating enzyme
MQAIKYLEIHVSHSCNLTCESCAHFSNSGHSGMLSPKEAAESLRAWQPRILPREVRLLGGEPTLNPFLIDLILLTKQTWPSAALSLTTNGFFLSRHPELGAVLARSSAVLKLSIHGNDDKYRSAITPAMAIIQRWKSECRLKVHIEETSRRWTRRHHGFGPGVLPFEDHDPRASWMRCEARECRQLFKGRLWKCAPIAYLQLQKDRYPGISSAWDPYLRYTGIGPECTEEELVAFESPAEEEICGMCPSRTERFDKPSPLIPRTELLKRSAKSQDAARSD